MTDEEQAKRFADGVTALAQECGYPAFLAIGERAPNDDDQRFVSILAAGRPETQALLAARLYGAMRERLEQELGDTMQYAREQVRRKR